MNKTRTSFPDFITDKFIFEVKPKDFWNSTENQEKSSAAKIYCELHNLKFVFVNYPVFIKTIIPKFLSEEIKFSTRGLEKFTRIYKKQLASG